jgi:hypothetical protein
MICGFTPIRVKIIVVGAGLAIRSGPLERVGSAAI